MLEGSISVSTEFEIKLLKYTEATWKYINLAAQWNVSTKNALNPLDLYFYVMSKIPSNSKSCLRSPTFKLNDTVYRVIS